MPRSGDPNDIKTGTGKANQNSVDANSFTNDLATGVGGLHGLRAHTNDPQAAHPASAISTTTTDGFYDNNDVQGDLDEIAALIPPRPGTVGNWQTNLQTTSIISGIPDWGVLKLNDAGHIARGSVTPPDPSNPNDDQAVYPYYNYIPDVASDNPPFDPGGNDPATDPTFNIDPAGTPDPTYTGGGVGWSHQGGFTRPQVGGSPIIETTRIFPTAGGAFQPVVVSGMLYPADRGVLALLHWPPGGSIGDFLAQPLTNRVVAAILCGQGILDDCDGAPGGIFTEGDPNIFSYPGRAAGQYQLRELHTGLVQGSGAPLPAPYNVPDPGAGQVRLGTDPNAGVPVVVGGIPILGGTTAATGGGNDNNFFRYRLPYLSDYSDTSDGLGGVTGLKFTPTTEKFRYFDKPDVSANFATLLTQAGDYTDLPDDYWQFQLARYRHRFTFQHNVWPAPTDHGSWLLVHFKTEGEFEKWARDGILPDDVTDGYETYSSSLLDYSSPESTDNLAEPAPPFDISPGYHVVRGAIYEDPDDFTTFTIDAIGYNIFVTMDEVMAVSGIKYWVPGTAGSKWTITNMNLTLSDVWENSYRLGNNPPTSIEITSGIWHQNPLFVFQGIFGAEPGSTNPPTTTATFAGMVSGGPGGERIEFRYDELDSASGHGPFTVLNGPLPADTADLLLIPADPMTFNGDQNLPHFSADARVRAFFRKPLGHQLPADTVLEALFPRPGGTLFLFHSTSQNPTDDIGVYGNFQTAGPGSPARASLETSLKDTEERFLDEVYRYAINNFDAGAFDPTWDGTKGNLVGPGLPFGPAGFIDVPVRVGANGAATVLSFIQQDHYTKDLATAGSVAKEAQVAGLPDRNPPVSDGVIAPMPSSGILLYPQTDYTLGYRPASPGDVTPPQFDYSGIADAQREYLRAFDLGFSRDASPIVGQVAGQPLFRIRVHGLYLADYAYAAPGPGSTYIAIMIKVPGLTNWMDLGRRNGFGPSKQDPLLDGAGCKIIGTQTVDGRDAQYGHRISDTLVDVGPAVNLATNSYGEVPILVRVIIKAAAASVLDWVSGGPDDSTANVAGLVGIEILRPE